VLLFYFAYRFIFNFIIPVVKATRQVKSQMREFQSKMQEQQQAESVRQSAFVKTPQSSSASAGKEDYIDFEEIK